MISTIEAYSRPYMERMQMRQSLPYIQASTEGQRRMEQAVSMGLGQMSDPESFRRTGTINPLTGMPLYGISRSPFGSWGQVGEQQTGLTKEERASIKKGRSESGATKESQPAFTGPESMGMTGSAMAFTPFSRISGGPQPTAPMAPIRSFLPQGNALTGFGGIPRFPYSNY